jgi:hypothetical protein
MIDPRQDPAISIPVLPSLDIARTRAFYATMGFDPTVYEAENYLIVRRDRIEIHFWLTGDRKLCENTSCYIRGGQIVTLYEEFSAQQIAGLKPLEKRPWNMLEFYVIDPDGNLLRFGCAPEEVGCE